MHNQANGLLRQRAICPLEVSGPECGGVPRFPRPWRSFLRNYVPDIAAIDMCVVGTATFRLL
jgi:hypothetical protein